MPPPNAAGDDEWTTIKPKNNRRRLNNNNSSSLGHDARNASRSALAAAQEALPPGTARPDGPVRSVSSIEAEYRTLRDTFEASSCCASLRALAGRIAAAAGHKRRRKSSRSSRGDDNEEDEAEPAPPVTKAVCLGIGTFDPPTAGGSPSGAPFCNSLPFSSSSRSSVRFFLLDSLPFSCDTKRRRLIQPGGAPSSQSVSRAPPSRASSRNPSSPPRTPPSSPPRWATPSWSTRAGATPWTAARCSTGCTSTAPSTRWPWPAPAALGGGRETRAYEDLPAVFVGTGWDVWDAVTLGQPGGGGGGDGEDGQDEDGDDDGFMRRLRVMEDTYERADFPQDDPAHGTAFSSTSVYWRRGAVRGGDPERTGLDDGGGDGSRRGEKGRRRRGAGTGHGGEGASDGPGAWLHS
ncbi:hypothetical protein ACCO45_009705 [Purpureocillium lilacinum]|uniref:Uncharacterized protein n=1 Tax=Purpureocillium lilacinum TaxID=33203 RepID=A0ACC4DLY4_PURLI